MDADKVFEHLWVDPQRHTMRAEHEVKREDLCFAWIEGGGSIDGLKKWAENARPGDWYRTMYECFVCVPVQEEEAK